MTNTKTPEQRIPDIATAKRCLQCLINTYKFSHEEIAFQEDVKTSLNMLITVNKDLVAALEGVIRVADRKTIEFDAARASLAKARGE